MRKLILILLLFVSAVVNGQTPAGYIKANMRFKWTAGIFDSALHVPQYNCTPSGIRTGGWVGDGAIGIDTTNHRMYIYSGVAWLRQAGEFVGWWVGKLQERPDPEQLFAEAQERMQALQPPQVDRRFVYGWDTVGGHQAQLAQRVKDAEEGKPSPFLWPWPSWNAVVRPLRAGMLGLVAGADGTGKSTYLECIAEHWAKGGSWTILRSGSAEMRRAAASR